MIFRETTTSVEIMQVFRDSVFELLDDISKRADAWDGMDMPERTRAVKTKKMLSEWFARAGGI